MCFNPRPPLLASEPSSASANAAIRCVSIHARHYWRASPVRCRTNQHDGAVSIHARHYWRASHRHHRPHRAARQFQSTPAITGERAGRTGVEGRCLHCFNPRPPLLASKPPAQLSRLVGITPFQSTPAITGERACIEALRTLVTAGFNPRPPLLASEPALGFVQIPLSSLFQSTPAITGERAR